MDWYNIFGKKGKPMENENKYDIKKVPLWERNISGLGEIGDSGFGITNLELYIQRSDFRETLKKFKESKLYHELYTNQDQK
ncbi:hypothetical protein JYT44_03065 [Caldithrix abyssi]|nr:hypothetical protein [Caldithrix abyssi]